MTKQEIITKFHLFIDDMTELSDAETSDLFDKHYRRINSMKPWEGTKAEGTGTTSTSLPYVALPEDFLYLTANNNHSASHYEAKGPVIFKGTTFDPIEVVSWSDRRQYRDSNRHAYIDIANKRLYFTKQPTAAEAIEYDYHKQMPELTLAESPWFSNEFHDALYHFMVADDYMIQQSDKAKSYADENTKAAFSFIDSMSYWNSQLIQLN